MAQAKADQNQRLSNERQSMHATCEGRVMLLAPTIKEVAIRERKEISKEETVMIECIQVSQEDVAHRAHELYVQRGGGPGKDVEDWVRAEKELSTEVVVGPMRAMAARSGRNLN